MLKNAHHISSLRQLRSFRSCPQATGPSREYWGRATFGERLLERDRRERPAGLVAKRKWAETALRESESEQWYRTLLEATHEHIFIVNRDGAFRYLTESPAGHIGARSFFSRSAADRHASNLEKAFATGESQYVEERRLSWGREVWLGTWLVPMRDAAGDVNAVVGLSRDISQRMRVEAASRASEAKFRELFAHVLEGVYQTTADGRILTANPALIEMLGYSSEEEFLGLDVARDLYKTPDARQVFVRTLAAGGEVRRCETTLKRKDGQPIVVLESARAVHDEHGNVLYFEGTVTDITEHKQLEEQFRHAQKMEAIGRLAGGVAHDFNNLLTSILGYCDLVLERTGEDDQRRDDIETIKHAANSAAGLTRQLLAFSRRQMLQPTVLDLNAIVANVHQMLGRTLGEGLDLETLLDPNLAAVEADAGQIEQVLMNLAINAGDAMGAGGKLTIETANVRLDEAYASEHPEVPVGPYVLLAVSDTGSGMTPHTLSHIFEPFFTTKDPGKGTGLGLATVYGIVKQSGGHIDVYSEVGRGTTFKIYLPRTGEPTGPVELEGSSPRSLVGSETLSARCRRRPVGAEAGRAPSGGAGPALALHAGSASRPRTG